MSRDNGTALTLVLTTGERLTLTPTGGRPMLADLLAQPNAVLSGTKDSGARVHLPVRSVLYIEQPAD